MTLAHYLKYRRRYEVIAVGILLLLIGTTSATTIVLENLSDGVDPNWLGAFATEFTAVFAAPFLLPLLIAFLNRLDLNMGNLRWRILWHIPGYLIFTLLFVGLFVTFRKLLWPLADYQYEFGPILLGLLYEMRKLFWVYLLIVTMVHTYRFILDRLQGEARFLSVADDTQPQGRYRTQFLVNMLDREFLVKVDEIEWVQSASNYVLLHCGGRQYPMRQTLKALSEELDPARFIRVHRTSIANLERVEYLQDKGETRLILASGAAVPVSRTYLTALRQALRGENATDGISGGEEIRP